MAKRKENKGPGRLEMCREEVIRLATFQEERLD